MTSLARMHTVVVPGGHLMAALLGQRDANLRQIEAAFPDASLAVRGNEVTVDGPQADIVARLIEELVVLVQRGQELDESVVRRSIDMVLADERPSSVLTDDIMRGAKGKQVRPIILTRPAVEAGERLGFLPGDLMAKIDPYLRPLYDALYDMVEPEGAQ